MDSIQIDIRQMLYANGTRLSSEPLCLLFLLIIYSHIFHISDKTMNLFEWKYQNSLQPHISLSKLMKTFNLGFPFHAVLLVCFVLSERRHFSSGNATLYVSAEVNQIRYYRNVRNVWFQQ
jgi:hypothetical protein